MYSLSTCWNSHRHTDGREMLEEIRDLGFEYAELSHGIRISLVPGILEAVEAGIIKISSLHNFCPLPMGVNHAAPNIFKFTATNRREWENAYKHTIKTIEMAERVGAKRIVLHMGKVEIKDYTDRLVDLIEAEKKETPKYEKLCQEVLKKREAKKEKFQILAYEMLRRIEDHAATRDIQFGIENREALEEIPFENDFPMLFNEFPGETVKYWHDCGHAQIKHNLGFIDHALHLAAMAEKLTGLHIHDVQYPGKDHCEPGTGSIDWESLKPFILPEHTKVLELSPRLSPEAVQRGFEFIKSVWGTE